MDHARDRQGRLIGTREAMPHRFYSCPVCSAEVFLRRGRKYQHHFAHRSNRGTPECELFHPNDYIDTVWKSPASQSTGNAPTRVIPPLSLGIQLEPEAKIKGRKLRRWSLNLTVPKSDDGHGRITIDFGTGRPRTFDLSRLMLEPYTAVAGLDAPEFGASWISPEVRRNYRDAVDERIPGLDRTLVNVFATTGAKNKPRADSLTWGNSYYFVWHSNLLSEIHRGLSALLLAPEADWRCALVTLPDDEEAEAKAWLDEFAGLSFNQQRRVFGVLLPAPCGLDVFGRSTIADAGKLLVGLNLGHSDHDGGRKFSASIGKEHAAASISGSGRHLFEIEAVLGKSALALQLDDAYLPSLAPYVEEAEQHVSEVAIVVRSQDGKTTRRFALHRTEAAVALREVRAGQLALVGLSSPQGVGGEFRWRVPPLIGWQCLALFTSHESTPSVAASPDELQKINSLLQNRSLDVQLDGGPFGAFYDAGLTQKADRRIRVLSPQIRQRLVWLCKSARVFIGPGKVPVDHLSDDALAVAFESLTVPPALTAHKTSLQRALQHDNGGRP